MKDATIGLILLQAVADTDIDAADRLQLYTSFATRAYPTDGARGGQLLRSLCANDVEVVTLFEELDADDAEEEGE